MTDSSDIRKRREELGLTQLALALAAGISPRHYVRIERGEVSTAVDVAQRLARALHCSVDDLWPLANDASN